MIACSIKVGTVVESVVFDVGITSAGNTGNTAYDNAVGTCVYRSEVVSAVCYLGSFVSNGSGSICANGDCNLNLLCADNTGEGERYALCGAVVRACVIRGNIVSLRQRLSVYRRRIGNGDQTSVNHHLARCQGSDIFLRGVHQVVVGHCRVKANGSKIVTCFCSLINLRCGCTRYCD